MEGAKVNGDVSPRDQSSGSGPKTSANVTKPVTSSSGPARSVISISGTDVTITTTGTDGGAKKVNKVTTTPLRSSHDPALTGKGHVSEKVRDTHFVNALSQKMQGNSGALHVPLPTAALVARSAPASINTSSRASASHSRSSSSGSEDISSKLSSLLQNQQQQQQQMQRQHAQRQQQQQRPNQATEDKETPAVAPPSAVVNGAGSSQGSSQRGSGASSPDIPPPPPPSAAVVRSISEQAVSRRIPDASYTPRPKSYSTQSAMPDGNGKANPVVKNDLMAALTATVTSGSPTSGLRKTRGPAKGGVTEVYVPKKKSAARKESD